MTSIIPKSHFAIIVLAFLLAGLAVFLTYKYNTYENHTSVTVPQYAYSKDRGVLIAEYQSAETPSKIYFTRVAGHNGWSKSFSDEYTGAFIDSVPFSQLIKIKANDTTIAWYEKESRVGLNFISTVPNTLSVIDSSDNVLLTYSLDTAFLENIENDNLDYFWEGMIEIIKYVD